ncbi:MAG: glycosyltransferase [Saccharospirillaceae bacterium]|nr:glycosyltransferase [Saccharospirillaceae bacterium]MCD8531350.1 glycosyltransferase [Saccharospirillaceae bacterium]
MRYEKRISIYTGGLGGGGAEKVCVTVANGLSALGWVVDLVVLDSNASKYHSLVDKSVNLVFLNVRARYSPYRVFSYLKKNPTKLVLSFSHELTVLLVLLRYFVGYDFKIVSRNINNLQLSFENSNSFWTKSVVFLLVRFFYAKSDFVINQCRGMEDQLLKWLPKLKGKTGFIYNPVNETMLHHHADLKFEEEFVLCVGRLEKQKAFHHAIRAFSMVHEQHPELYLYIVGDGSLKQALINLTVNLGVENKVRFIGFTSDIGAYYKHAKLTLLTSLYEGFPNVLIESIAVGTPVVAFDCVSGPNEIVVEGVNGYLVKQGDVDDLFYKIITCLSGDHDASEVISTSQLFMVDSIIEKYQACLLSVAGRS